MKKFRIPTSVKIAFRNVFRNRRRTLLTLSSIVLGSAAIIDFDGYRNFADWGLREMYIRSQLGHLQIYKKGYRASKGMNPFAYLIANSEDIKKTIADTLGDRLKVVTARLELNGLITKGGQSYNFIATGIEVEAEQRMSMLDDGRSSALKVRRGQALTGQEVGSVLLGNELCDALGVAEGDLLSLMGASAIGALNATDLVWKGCFSTVSKEYDKVAAIMPLADAKRFSATEDVLKLVVMLKDTDMTAKARQDLEAAFAAKGYDLEMVSWHELADYYKQVMVFLGGMFMVIATIIVFVVVFSIVNTLTMSVFERVQEIGTIRAMGAEGGSIVKLFVIEGIMLGLIGGAIGMLFGGAVGVIVNHAKILLPPPPGSSEGFLLQLRLYPSSFAIGFMIALVSSFVASIYPAMKAAKLRVVDALRHV
ncbi:MAG: ABC transporter permease [Leptospiraceae bacterium]|nr:ABC transporter permease [Leptospiraceae bacterium]